MTPEEINTGMSALEVSAEMVAESEFNTEIWPRLNASYPGIEKFQPLMKLMYCSGAVAGVMGMMETTLTGARQGCDARVAAERERCAKIADNYTEYWPKSACPPDAVAAKCIAAAIRGKDHGCDPPQAEGKYAEVNSAPEIRLDDVGLDREDLRDRFAMTAPSIYTSPEERYRYADSMMVERSKLKV